MAALAFVLTLAAGAAITTVGVLGLVGRLPRNSWAGIRTRYTLSSDEAWAEVHRGAAPILIFGGVAVTMVSLAFLPFAVLGEVPGPLAVGVAAALAVVSLIMVLAAARAGTGAARRRGL